MSTERTEHISSRRARHHPLAPPSWLLNGLKPSAAPIPWAAVARASVAMSVPLAVGFALDEPEYGALASMGALAGVIGDTADAYRMRVLNIAVPQLFGAVGVALGTLVYGHGWLAVGALTLIALVSGMISSIGTVASVSGLLLLLNAVIGAGLPLPEPWWTAPLLLSAGGLFVLALSLLGWPLRHAAAGAHRRGRHLPDPGRRPGGRRLTRRPLRRTPAAGHPGHQPRLRPRARPPGPGARAQSLPGAAAGPAQRGDPAGGGRARRPPARPAAAPEIPAAVRDLADAVEEGRTGTPVLELPAAHTPAERAVDAALRHAAKTVYIARPDLDNVDDRLGRPAALRVRARRAVRDMVLSRASWRYGLRLALCIGIAQSLVSVIEFERSYWVALTVTFVLKPDFGSVFSRAVLRALGTAGGLVVAAAVLSEVPRGWWDVPVMVVLAGLIPAFSVKGYAFQTAAITPVILLLSDLLNHQGFDLIRPRLVDSLIGCAITLVAGYLLWPESWHTRIGDRLADTVDDAARYVERAFAPVADGAAHAAARTARLQARRRIYRDLSGVRSEFQRALTEPPPTGARAAAWWPLVVAVERIVDATTAARVRVNHGATPPPAEEVESIARQLRELAVRVRSSSIPVRVEAGPPGEAASVLAPVHQEIAAALAIARPES